MDELAGKRIVIVGLARQGIAFARYACEAGATLEVVRGAGIRAGEFGAAAIACSLEDPHLSVLGYWTQYTVHIWGTRADDSVAESGDPAAPAEDGDTVN